MGLLKNLVFGARYVQDHVASPAGRPFWGVRARWAYCGAFPVARLEVENAVNTGQDVILRHQLLKRAGDEQLPLIPPLTSSISYHPRFPTQDIVAVSHILLTFSTTP